MRHPALLAMLLTVSVLPLTGAGCSPTGPDAPPPAPAPAPTRAPAARGLPHDELPPEPDLGTPDEGHEPPLHYRVTLGDRTVETVDGTTVKLDGVFSQPELRVSVLDHRYLRRRGVTLAFPSHFAFEAVLGEQASWTLSGNDFRIILFDNGTVTVPVRSTVDAMVERLGDAVRGRSPATLELAGRRLGGETFEVDLAGVVQRHEVYALPGKRPQVLMLLDAPPRGAAESAERRVAMAALQRSFRVE